MSNTHHINSLRYKVACPDEALAFELRNTLSSVITQEITDVIDEICTRYVGEEEWIHIPKLEINLGNLPSQAFHGYVTGLFGQQFEQQLRKAVNGIHPQQRKAGKQVAESDILFFFLEKGFLPAWALAQELDLEIIIEHVFTENTEKLKAFLRRHQDNKFIWQRIVGQLSVAAKDNIIALFPNLAIAFRALQKNPEGVSTALTSMLILQDLILKCAPELLRVANNSQNLTEDLLLKIIGDQNRDKTHPQLQAVMTTVEMEQLKEDAIQLTSTIADNKNPFSHDADDTSTSERIMVATAGIVLLQPFFKAIFSQLKLWQNDEWVSIEAQQKAIHVLHYLATGEQQKPEWDLLLEKIICGLQPECPIVRTIVLEAEEQEECNSLLASVIEHWTALKSTSVPALQEVFLRRAGMLTQTNTGWMLQVERRTHDVLIESLPWSFSILKFPWTNYTIEVAWL